MGDALARLGVPDWYVVCGSVAPLKGLLDACGKGVGFSRRVLQLVHESDLVGLDGLVAKTDGLTDGQKTALRRVVRLNGSEAVVDELDCLLEAADVPMRERGTQGLRALVRSCAPLVRQGRLRFDFSIINSFDYYTGLVFKVEGDNIAKVSASISQGELYRMTHSEMSQAEFDEKWPKGHSDNSEGHVHMTYWGDDEGPICDDFCEAVGPGVEDAYDPDVAYGFYQPASMVETLEAGADDDLKSPFWNLVDTFDGAVLDVTVTYEDGSAESKSYDLKAGKLKVKFTEEGEGFDLLQEFTDGENDPFIYGLLATQRG